MPAQSFCWRPVQDIDASADLEHERDVDIIYGQTFAAATNSAEMAGTLLYLPSEAAEEEYLKPSSAPPRCSRVRGPQLGPDAVGLRRVTATVFLH